MMTRTLAGLAVVSAAAAALAFTTRPQLPVANPAAPAVAAPVAQPPAGAAPREADRDAIRKSAREFAEAFNKADAKAVAALWAENAEIHEAGGELVRGRANIEKAYADFFQENPGVKVEVLVEAVRFPAPDLAVEEGVLRQVRPGKELPGTTLYRVTHAREGGTWRMAVSQEVGAGQDRLEDLDWLVGEWAASVAGSEVTLSFARDAAKPFILGKFSRKDGKADAGGGTFRIGLDRDLGRLRSWHFDDDGGHGQAVWVRDGGRWVLDAAGVTGNGTPTAGLNVLGRVDADTITWRSIDRVLGDRPLPDTVPLRLTRVRAGQ